MNYAQSLAHLASSSGIKKHHTTSSSTTIEVTNGHASAFDLSQEIESAYQSAYVNFSIARETMPEWIAYEKATRAWKDFRDLHARRACVTAQEAYTTACNRLPEWKAYFAAFTRRAAIAKRREELRAQGRRQ